MKDIERIKTLSEYFIKHETTFPEMITAITQGIDDRFSDDDFEILVKYCDFFSALSGEFERKRNYQN